MASQFTWDTLDTDEKRETLGRLKELESLQSYIDLLREGYTRLLKVNNVDDDGTIKEVKTENLINFNEKKLEIIDEESSGDDVKEL